MKFYHLLWFLAACGPFSRVEGTLEPEPSCNLRYVSGNQQTAEAGNPLPAKLRVQVLDQNLQPIEGAHISFQIIEGGGQFIEGANSTTNDLGVAEAIWKLGPVSIAQKAEAILGDTCHGSHAAVSFTATALSACPDIIEYHGEHYKTMLIQGDTNGIAVRQCWLARNLNVGQQLISTCSELQELDCRNNIVEKYCYDNDPDNCSRYGGLYTWYEAIGQCDAPLAERVRGICPEGWHIPSDNEWKVLERILGMPSEELNQNGEQNFRGELAGVGDALKLGGHSGFEGLFPGFTLFPHCNTPPPYREIDMIGVYWSASIDSIAEDNGLLSTAWKRDIISGRSGVIRRAVPVTVGASVRCLKD